MQDETAPPINHAILAGSLRGGLLSLKYREIPPIGKLRDAYIDEILAYTEKCEREYSTSLADEWRTTK